MNLNKGHLSAKLAEAAGVSKAKGAMALNAVIGAITGTLKKGGKVTLPGFGTWMVVARKARAGVNPRTGAKIKIAARRVARFSVGKGLKEMIK